jgi:hypothetical protein
MKDLNHQPSEPKRSTPPVPKPEPGPERQKPSITPQEVPEQPGRPPAPVREHPSDPKPSKPSMLGLTA